MQLALDSEVRVDRGLGSAGIVVNVATTSVPPPSHVSNLHRIAEHILDATTGEMMHDAPVSTTTSPTETRRRRGRPQVHADASAARRAANTRAADRARADGLVQRSLRLPASCWSLIRDARASHEKSDAQTLERILRQAETLLISPHSSKM